MATYATNIGKFIEDHPGWMIFAGTGGFGYAARRRGARGRARGPAFEALRLDQLDQILAREDKLLAALTVLSEPQAVPQG